MNTKNIIMVVIVVVTTCLLIGAHSVSAKSSSSNYNNGYRDGLGDCHTDQSTWAMNLASNAGHHSSEYLAGHDAGLAACNSQSTTAVSNQNSNNVDQNNRISPQSQGATASQHCFVLVGSCNGANVNQGQDVTN